MKKIFLIPSIAATLVAFTPTVVMVGCGPDKPVCTTINLAASICGSVKINSYSVDTGTTYIEEKDAIDNQAQPSNGCKFTYWTDQDNNPLTEDHVFVNGETITAHFETLQECFSWSFNDDMTAVLEGLSNEWKGVTEVVIPSTIESSGTYTVTTINDDAFRENTILTGVEIPDSVKFINSFAFYGCTGLINLTIGSGIEVYHEAAFFVCSGLTKITIGARVTAIDGRAFGSCYQLAYVDLTALTNPPSLGERVFINCHKDLALVVAKGMVETFQQADGWEDYADRIIEEPNQN